MTSRLGRIMQGHFKKATREPDEYIVYAMNPEKISEVWILLRNMIGEEDEWVGGYFLFKLVAPNTFPTDPPSFYAQHENGVYAVNAKCCISIGEYHKDQYRAVLGIRGFAIELSNGMMNWRSLTKLGGINLLTTPVEKKRAIASGSLEVLRQNFPDQMKLLDESFAAYSKKWKIEHCNDSNRMRLNFMSTVFPLKHDGTIKEYTADMEYESDVNLDFLIPMSSSTAQLSESIAKLNNDES